MRITASSHARYSADPHVAVRCSRARPVDSWEGTGRISPTVPCGQLCQPERGSRGLADVAPGTARLSGASLTVLRAHAGPSLLSVQGRGLDAAQFSVGKTTLVPLLAMLLPRPISPE